MSKLHWVALVTAAGVGGKTLTNLLTHFGTPENIFDASLSDLVRVPRIGQKTAAAIIQIDLDQIKTDIARFEGQGGQIVTWHEAPYPAHLLRCENAPPVLFVRGDLTSAEERSAAIVGTRQPRPDSRRLAHEMAYELAKRGWVIVSGLAIGIDTAAHQGALEAKGKTVAVLGAGVMDIYPARNETLAHDIMQSGAVIGEVHPYATVSPQQLIARNRIQSGLSKAVIVVESGVNGGSMSTARRAVEQGRGLFAVVGGEMGCDALLQAGAVGIDPAQVDWDTLSTQLEQIVVQPPDKPQQLSLF